MPGPIFGKYEVQQRLATGGMGEVFLAKQIGIPGFERHVILKSLLPDVAEMAGAIDDFLDEARVAATLNHPHVVSVYEVGLWEGVYYIAMEYIDGFNLSALRKSALARQQLFPLEIAARIACDVAQALDHAHHARDLAGQPLEIVHRDISPQNIMVRRDGVTKVVDFGIARATNRPTRTQVGVMKGKPSYMAPEQIRGERLDGRSDQYALGVVLWELLTGRRLFKGSAEIDIFERVLNDPIPPPSHWDAEIPAELDAIALQMLEREPARRFPSCRDAATALSGWIDAVRPGLSQHDVAAFVETISSSSSPKPDSSPPTPAPSANLGLEETRPPKAASLKPPQPPGAVATKPQQPLASAWTATPDESTPAAMRNTVAAVRPRKLSTGMAKAIGSSPPQSSQTPTPTPVNSAREWMGGVISRVAEWVRPPSEPAAPTPPPSLSDTGSRPAPLPSESVSLSDTAPSVRWPVPSPDPAASQGRASTPRMPPVRPSSSPASSIPPARPSQLSGGATPVKTWDPSVLLELESALTVAIGPVARVLVRRAGAEATSLDDLCLRLERTLTEDADRKAFRDRIAVLRKGSPTR